MPKARHSKKTSEPPKSDTFSPLEEVGEFFEQMDDEGRALAKSVVAWARHPLGESLDAAEATPVGGRDPPGPVDAALMERKLRETLSSHPSPVLLVRSAQVIGNGAKDGEKPTWLLIIGESDDPGKVLTELAAKAEGLSSADLPFRDVVIWTRQWDSSAWERVTSTGLGAMEERPIWLKVWESSGSLLGPLRFLQ